MATETIIINDTTKTLSESHSLRLFPMQAAPLEVTSPTKIADRLSTEESDIHFVGSIGELFTEVQIRQKDSTIQARLNHNFNVRLGGNFDYASLIDHTLGIPPANEINLLLATQIPTPNLYTMSALLMVRALRQAYGLPININFLSYTFDAHSLDDMDGVKPSLVTPSVITGSRKNPLFRQMVDLNATHVSPKSTLNGIEVTSTETNQDLSHLYEILGLNRSNKLRTEELLARIDALPDKHLPRHIIYNILQKPIGTKLSLVELHQELSRLAGMPQAICDLHGFLSPLSEVLLTADEIPELIDEMDINQTDLYIGRSGPNSSQYRKPLYQAREEHNLGRLADSNLIRPNSSIYYGTGYYTGAFTGPMQEGAGMYVLLEEYVVGDSQFMQIVNQGVETIQKITGRKPLIQRAAWLEHYDLDENGVVSGRFKPDETKGPKGIPWKDTLTSVSTATVFFDQEGRENLVRSVIDTFKVKFPDLESIQMANLRELQALTYDVILNFIYHYNQQPKEV